LDVPRSQRNINSIFIVDVTLCDIALGYTTDGLGPVTVSTDPTTTLDSLVPTGTVCDAGRYVTDS
jgi:hypothetical protein